MLKNSFWFLLPLFSVVPSHPTLEIPGESSSYLDSSFNDGISHGGTKDGEEAMALVKLRRHFGNPEPGHRPPPDAKVPQFMAELYNAITEDKLKNPYNAKSVKSLIDEGSSLSHHYSFNFTGLDINEAVVAAELHLHLKTTPLETVPPAICPSTYYAIRVYQVLEEHQLDNPEFHKLLNDNRVGVHASGWQTLDVKQAVLSWMSGAPNLGLLVTVSNSFGEGVAANFSRGSEGNGEQPILVLFIDDDYQTTPGKSPVPYQQEPKNDPEDGFKRQKREATGSENCKFAGALTSMEIYERAQMREEVSRRKKAAADESSTSDETLEPMMVPQRRSRLTLKVFTITAPAPRCGRREYDVDFEKDLGWEWVIAPKHYSFYRCRGNCDSFNCENRYLPTPPETEILDHLLGKSDVDNPCCRATKYSNFTMLYFDRDYQVTLTKIPNTVIDDCGCQ